MCNTVTNTFGENEIQQFINDGFIKIEHAFSEELAVECRAILWKTTGCNEHDPITWTLPVTALQN